jgi:hypothetical protein
MEVVLLDHSDLERSLLFDDCGLYARNQLSGIAQVQSDQVSKIDRRRKVESKDRGRDAGSCYDEKSEEAIRDAGGGACRPILRTVSDR